MPGAAALAGATVLEVPPGVIRDIRSVFRAVNGGWKTVNGYSGWGPSYYNALFGAGRAEDEGMLRAFQQRGELHVLVEEIPRLRALVEQQPGVARVASDGSLTVYRLPRRQTNALARPAGERLRPRELRSACSSELLPKAMDDDETSLWQCTLWDDRQALTADLGDVRTVGAVVHNLGWFSWLYPAALTVETSEDGASWNPAWSGAVFEQTILAGIADPSRLRIVVAFPPRQARFIRMRAASGVNDVPWTIAELEVWSSWSESR